MDVNIIYMLVNWWEQAVSIFRLCPHLDCNLSADNDALSAQGRGIIGRSPRRRQERWFWWADAEQLLWPRTRTGPLVQRNGVKQAWQKLALVRDRALAWVQASSLEMSKTDTKSSYYISPGIPQTRRIQCRYKGYVFVDGRTSSKFYPCS